MLGRQARVLHGRAIPRISLCVLAVTCLPRHSSHAQRLPDVPDASVLTVYVHPEVRTVIDAPEVIQLTEFMGDDDFFIIPSSSNRTLFLNPHAHIDPHSESVLRIFSTNHEWSVLLKAVALPKRATEQVELVVAKGRPRGRDSKPHVSVATEADSVATEADTETPGEDDPFSLSLRALSGRGMTWLRTSDDESYATASHTMLGLRLLGVHRHTWWAAALDLDIAWADEDFYFLREGEKRDVRPFWARSVFQIRAKRSGGPVSSSLFFGFGARLRLAGDIITAGSKQTLDPTAIGGLALVGFGLERRLGSGVLGMDIIGEVGSPDIQWSLVLLFHVGCLSSCGD